MKPWKGKLCQCGVDAELMHIHKGKNNYWCWKCWRVAFQTGMQK